MVSLVKKQSSPRSVIQTNSPVAQGAVRKSGPTLQVTVRGGDFFSPADPYVKVTFGKQAHQTTVKQDAGGTVSFHETFWIDLNSELETPYELDVTVMDQDVFIDELMGNTRINVRPTLTRGSSYDHYDLQDAAGRPSGNLTIAMKFLP